MERLASSSGPSRPRRDRSRRAALLVALLVTTGTLTACSSSGSPGSAGSTGSTDPMSPTTVADHRGGVPPGYPLDVDVVAPLVITSVGADPIPVMGTDGMIHVVYELEVLNAGPRPATITRIETLADGPEGPVVATIGPDEVQNLSILIADHGLTSFTDIPVGRTTLVLLDDVFAGRLDVPRELTHRISASFGDAPVAELEALGARYPDTVTQVGGTVRPSDQTPVVIGPPVAGGDWVATNGCCGRSSHRGAVMAVGGRINAAERFAIDFLRLDTTVSPAVTFHGDGSRNEDYLAYGVPLLAVADGTVVSVLSDVPDSTPQVPPTDLSFAQLGGSYVILDIGGGNFVYYAHMVPGSATVRVGDKVVRGQTIGALGNSGNSSEAHLHLHVTRAGLPLSADNVPFELDRFTFVGTLTGDDVVPGPEAGERELQLPLDGSVVDFPAGP